MPAKVTSAEDGTTTTGRSAAVTISAQANVPGRSAPALVGDLGLDHQRRGCAPRSRGSGARRGRVDVRDRRPRGRAPPAPRAPWRPRARAPPGAGAAGGCARGSPPARRRPRYSPGGGVPLAHRAGERGDEHGVGELLPRQVQLRAPLREDALPVEDLLARRPGSGSPRPCRRPRPRRGPPARSASARRAPARAPAGAGLGEHRLRLADDRRLLGNRRAPPPAPGARPRRARAWASAASACCDAQLEVGRREPRQHLALRHAAAEVDRRSREPAGRLHAEHDLFLRRERAGDGHHVGHESLGAGVTRPGAEPRSSAGTRPWTRTRRCSPWRVPRRDTWRRAELRASDRIPQLYGRREIGARRRRRAPPLTPRGRLH